MNKKVNLWVKARVFKNCVLLSYYISYRYFIYVQNSYDMKKDKKLNLSKRTMNKKYKSVKKSYEE